jgi:hypothetical protein
MDGQRDWPKVHAKLIVMESIMSVIGEHATHKTAAAFDWATAIALIAGPFFADPIDWTLRTIALLVGIAIGVQRLLRNRTGG